MSQRIIPCLDVKDGRVVKGVRFDGLKEMGDPLALAQAYADQGADAIVVLDIIGTAQGRPTYLQLLQDICQTVSTPVISGGGVRSFADLEPVFAAGAAKAAMASAALQAPDLINQAVQAYGTDRIVVAIDAAKRLDGSGYELVTAGGKNRVPKDPVAWAREAESRGAGEILLTSLDADGGKAGYDLVLTKAVAQAVTIPVIASGGAGSLEDFVRVFAETPASAALAASLFHQGTLTVPQIRQALS